MDMPLSDEQKDRYSRFLRLTDVHEEDMELINSTNIGVIGVGGLGSSSSRLLAAMGFKKLILVDPDIVELSNIQRQLLFNTEDVGKKKVEAASINLQKLNPQVEIETYDVAIQSNNITDILRDVDIIIDGLDSFKARRIVNEYSIEKKKPYVFAGAVEYYANTTTFLPCSTGCLNCVMGDAKDNSEMTAASIGITPEILPIVTSIQVREAVLIATKKKPNLFNKLLSIDINSIAFDIFEIQKNENCEVCGASSSKE
ncbi:MAG: hypothetical protein GF411_09575 [Candidatus Lokiarchaeota archaeon]|nr:hypothetical protein [Candidatus Lokiarchaeota archaeon]